MTLLLRIYLSIIMSVGMVAALIIAGVAYCIAGVFCFVERAFNHLTNRHHVDY